MAEPVCVVPAGDWTGEGALWDAAGRAVYWVDISRFLVHRHDPESKATWSWLFPEPPTALGLTNRPGTLIVALASKVILWQPANDARADFAVPDRNWPHVRLNDGRPDPAGNFWVGSMQNNVGPDGHDSPITDTTCGRLFRIDARGAITVEKTGIGITNTFCWSPDRKTFYCGDTLTNAISAWEYDASAGTIGNERPFFAGFERGGPDGSAIDSQGCVWNARFGGSCIVRIAPDGTIDRIVEMPVANITTCTFGGAGLKTLYITTARGNADRLGGSLFALEVNVAGMPENVFRLGG